MNHVVIAVEAQDEFIHYAVADKIPGCKTNFRALAVSR